MNTRRTALFSVCLLTGSSLACLGAQAPSIVGVTFNGETDVMQPLASNTWHTITASYRYDGNIHLLTNTFLVIARGGDLRMGFYVGYNLPTNRLMFVKRGTWNEPEVTGAPGEAGRIIENDQGYIDCEKTVVHRTEDEISVAYRVRFKRGVLRGSYSVHQYVEDVDIRYEGFRIMAAITIDRDDLVHRTDMPDEWVNSLKPEGRVAPPLTLADRRVARCSLVVPQDAERVERKAAADLQQFLNRMSGADFPIITEDEFTEEAGSYISIGRTELLAASRSRWKDADLAEEGYAIDVAGENIYIYGGRGRGLMHGVYALLEEDLGCRWYSKTSLDTPRISMRRLTARVVPRMYIPVLEMRDPYIHTMFDPAWSLRNRTNSPHARIPTAWGGSLRFHFMGHTYANYFPTKEYFEDHPEYYALVNDRRQPSQICHTNEDVIRLSIEKTLEIFRNNPEVTVTAIGPNDGRGFCDCPDCKRLDDENGGRSGSFFYHVNRIAEGVKDEFPNNRLISLAYLDYAPPPTNLKVDDYIIIHLCTDSHAWVAQFCFLWETDRFQEILKAWHALDATVYIWDYTTDYVHFLVPMANWRVVAENTRFLIRHGATGIMYESEYNDIDEMRAWVWAKQLWDPTLDTLTLMKDFVFGYYKEAAQPIWDFQMMMWDYWEKWHGVSHEPGILCDNPILNNLHCSYAPDGPMFTPEFMREMRRCFEEAEGLAQSEDIMARIRRAKLSLLYLELAQNLGYYTEFGDFVYGASMRQPRAEREAFQARLDEFTETCKDWAPSMLGIPITVDRITSRWQACIDTEELPAPRAYLPAEWVFVPDADDRGVTDRWYADQANYDAVARLNAGTGYGREAAANLGEGFTRVHINRGVGFEQQGFPGFDGYGWYFQYLEVPEDLADSEHLYLYFRRVNEEAWIYINDELVFERSYASTGQGVGDLHGRPFGFDARAWLQSDRPNRIAIRTKRSSGLGGIHFPAMIIGTDEAPSIEQLDGYRH